MYCDDCGNVSVIDSSISFFNKSIDFTVNYTYHSSVYCYRQSRICAWGPVA